MPDPRVPPVSAAARPGLEIRLAAAGGLLTSAIAVGGCNAAHPVPHSQVVLPAPPPRDDGAETHGGAWSGIEHAAALEELRLGRLSWRADRQNSVRLELPDAEHWTRVKFLGVKSLVGFRYGKDHHAIVAGVVVHTDDENTAGACSSTFEGWAQPWLDAFEVNITHDPPRALDWNGKIVDVDSLLATTATLGDRDQFAVGYAVYPAWKGACLVLGIAVPAHEELERARAVRDRFVAEVLPAVKVLSAKEPAEQY